MTPNVEVLGRLVARAAELYLGGQDASWIGELGLDIKVVGVSEVEEGLALLLLFTHPSSHGHLHGYTMSGLPTTMEEIDQLGGIDNVLFQRTFELWETISSGTATWTPPENGGVSWLKGFNAW